MKVQQFFETSPILSGEQICQNAIAIAENNRITLSYDWIEFTGEMAGAIPEHPFLFNSKDEKRGSQFFSEVHTVSTIYHGEVFEFATLEMKPRPSFLSPTLVKVKLHNRFCYTPDIAKSVKEFCREFGIEFKHYIRLDYAIDFQAVKLFGSNIQALMHSFASKELVLKGKSLTIFTKVGGYTGLTWGRRASGLSITLYNKTTDMVKKGIKPWISELHENAKFEPSAPVYRLEFSTKKPKCDIVSEEGETLGTYADIEFLNSFNEYVNFLYSTHFKAAVREDGVRHSRCEQYNPLELFMQPTIYKPVATCVKPQSNNIKKSVIKNIVMEASYMQKRGDVVGASYAWELAMTYVERYSLAPWWDRLFSDLGIRSCYMTHWDILNTESIKTHNLKQRPLWN